MIRVVIIDDHELTRRGIRQVLADDEEFVVVGEAGDGIEGWEIIQQFTPDVALIDVRMGGLAGPALCQRVTSAGIPTVCIILTSYTDEEPLNAALSHGARGYIVKDVGGQELLESLRRIMAGGSVLDSRATAHVVQWIRDGNFDRLALSTMDIEILSRVAQGLTNREIGDAMHFSENTVKAHINRMTDMLHAKNRVEAAVIAYRHGLI